MDRRTDGTFSQGNKGRPKGTPNKITAKIRGAITHFIDCNFERVQQDFEQLKPRERVRFFVDLLQYAVPKYQSVQFITDIDRLTDEQANEILNQLIEQNDDQ